MSDIYNLRRFIEAQDEDYDSVLSELKSGAKYGCWMWYIFPQIKGLGMTGTSQHFAISSVEEAKAYLAQPLLGTRLKQCTQLVMNIEDHSAEQIFHSPDYLKFRSCMTLFDLSSGDNNIFHEAILKYFNGEPDPLTLNILEKKH